jgi:c-di-GMP-binding flagellar brake protein YcgR
MTHAEGSAGSERRLEQRVPARLPVYVRGTEANGERFEVMTSSVNFSRGGTALTTSYAFEVGTEVELTVHSTSSSHPEKRFSAHGCVVHVRPYTDIRCNIVGIQFTGGRFNRIFA